LKTGRGGGDYLQQTTRVKVKTSCVRIKIADTSQGSLLTKGKEETCRGGYYYNLRELREKTEQKFGAKRARHPWDVPIGGFHTVTRIQNPRKRTKKDTSTM